MSAARLLEGAVVTDKPLDREGRIAKLREVRDWLVREQGYTPEQAADELPDPPQLEQHTLRTGRRTLAAAALPDRLYLKCSGKCGRVLPSDQMNTIRSKHGGRRAICGKCLAGGSG